MTLAILGVRGAAAVGVLLALAGGVSGLAAIALAVAAGLWTALLVASDRATGGGLYVLLQELVIGTTLGIMAAAPLVAARTAGSIIDRVAGARGVYRRVLGVVTAAVFVGVDGHVAVVRAIVHSHRALPAIADVRPRVMAVLWSLVPSAIVLAAPWLVTAAIVALALGVAERVAARSAMHVPGAMAAPAIIATATAALVATFATAFARMVIVG